jgi:4-hydroxy-tetrahydrodipicolinate reductase
MGRAVAFRFLTDGKVNLVGAVDPCADRESIGHLSGAAAHGPDIVESVDELPDGLEADIALDFSTPSACRENLEPCLKRGWDSLVGVTGFNDEDRMKFRKLAEKYQRKVVLVPNFCVGVNLLLKFAKEASRVFERVEIIELHHDKKADAPSGTALHTAALISAESKRTEPPCMGDESRGRLEHDIPIHAVRLPGLLAHQEVLFGNPGEVLTIRHDTTDRVAFLSGIYLAIERIGGLEVGFTVGLDWAFE